MRFGNNEKIAYLAGMNNNYNDGVIISKRLSLKPDQCGGDYWLTKYPSGNNTARYQLTGFSLNGFGYICNGTTSNEVNQYNDTENIYLTKANGGTARAYLTGFSLNGFGYICNGFTTNEVNQYNDITNIWSIKENSGVAKYGLTGFSLNGFGYICNGYIATYTNEVRQYNDILGIWNTKANGGTARLYLTGFSLNGFGYICNGSSASRLNEVNQYTDIPETWITRANGGTARDGLAGFSLNGFGYICNGNTGSFQNEVNQYNNTANIWTMRTKGGTARDGLIGFSLNGFGYICNGWIGSATNEINQYRNHSFYNIVSPFKVSSKPPKNILISTNLNNNAITLPIQLSTSTQANSASWMYMESNKDSLLKTGQTLTQMVSSNSISGSIFYNYEIKVGIPEIIPISGDKFSSALISSVVVGAISGNPCGSYFTVSPVSTQYPRNMAAAWNLNGLGYVAYGASASAALWSRNIIEQYNNATDVMIFKNEAGGTQKCLTGAICLNGFGYACGGETKPVGTRTCEVTKYNDSLNAFLIMTPIPLLVGSSSGISLNGFGYIVGGAGAATCACMRYNDYLNNWSTMAQDIVGRERVTLSAVYGNIFAAFGSARAVASEYNIAQNVWITRLYSPFVITRGRSTGFSIEDKMIGMGGDNTTTNAGVYSSTAYFPLLNYFKNDASLPGGNQGTQRCSNGISINNIGYVFFPSGDTQSYLTVASVVYKYITAPNKIDLTVTLMVEE